MTKGGLSISILPPKVTALLVTGKRTAGVLYAPSLGDSWSHRGQRDPRGSAAIAIVYVSNLTNRHENRIVDGSSVGNAGGFHWAALYPGSRGPVVVRQRHTLAYSLSSSDAFLLSPKS